jgi:hypothetical protein
MQEILAMGLGEQDYPATSDDYYTPQWIFEALKLEFDIDPAQPIGGIPWIPVKRYFTILDDGLAQEWVGRVWLNPPFSKPGHWIQRFIEHKNGLLLVAFSRSKAFNYLWDHAEAVTALPSNLLFETPKDGLKNVYMPVGLFAMGEENVEALKSANFGKVR